LSQSHAGNRIKNSHESSRILLHGY
jgi:hypothetical protein